MAIATADRPDPRREGTNGDWAGAIRQRRKALLQRFGMAAASALIFSPVLGWPVSVAWVLGYFLIQLLDLYIFAPIIAGRAERLRGGRRVAGWMILSANAGYFGSLSVALWMIGGPMGGICAVMLLSAGAIYSVVNAPRSTSVMLLTASVQFAYLASTPVFMAMNGASPAFVTAAAIAVGVFVTYCLSTWQRMNEARAAESAARVEAEQKRNDAERIMEGRSAFLAAIASVGARQPYVLITWPNSKRSGKPAFMIRHASTMQLHLIWARTLASSKSLGCSFALGLMHRMKWISDALRCAFSSPS
jgi:hypothetical protein